MSKLNCDIIKDLLPSYVDGICSQASSELIEGHMAYCMDCRQYLDRMKNVELVSDLPCKKEIDYMKKVKLHNTRKCLVSMGLLLSFIFIGITFIMTNYGNIPTKYYFILLPILVLYPHYMLSDRTSLKINSKWKVGMSILGVILISYSTYLMFAITRWIGNDKYPFGMNVVMVGPFVYYQLLVSAILQIAIYVGTLIVSVKTANSHDLLLDINITGSCLSLAFISILKKMSSMVSYEEVRNTTILIIFAEGAIMSVILYILGRIKKSTKITADNKHR